jgi:hypothetical protein
MVNLPTRTQKLLEHINYQFIFTVTKDGTVHSILPHNITPGRICKFQTLKSTKESASSELKYTSYISPDLALAYFHA